MNVPNVEELLRESESAAEALASPDQSITKALPGPLFTVTEVADYLRISTSTIYRLVRDGSLKGIRIGQSLRFTGSNIADFLTENSVI